MVSRVSSELLLERVVVLESATKAAHARLDKTEILISESLGTINKELTKLVALVNWGKGALWAMGVFGAILGAILMKVVSKWIG